MDSCVFCATADKQIPSAIVLESETSLAFLDNNPIAAYHTLVIPKTHYVDIIDVPLLVLHDVTELIHQVCQLYSKKLGINSYQIFNNTGPDSSQTVLHLHFHILPRHEDDAIKFSARHVPELVKQYPEMLARLR